MPSHYYVNEVFIYQFKDSSRFLLLQSVYEIAASLPDTLPTDLE